MAHTPTPWKLDGYDFWHQGESYESVTYPHLFTGITICEALQHSEVAQANARLIVRAVNAFEPMREALREARQYVAMAYECAFPDQRQNEEVLEAIDAALALADKEQL